MQNNRHNQVITNRFYIWIHIEKERNSLVVIYMGKAKERVLVVLLSDLRETLPEYAIGPE